MARFDVVLIGSGISVLTCAAILSKKGKSVCVLERYVKPGGYLHGFRRFGHHFDTGAHYMGAMKKNQPFRQLLEFVGVFEEELFVPLDENAFDVLYFPKMTVELPQGYAAFADRLKGLFPAEGQAIDAFLTHLQNSSGLFQTYKFQDHVDQDKLMFYINTPLAKIVEPLTQNEDLKVILYSHCLLHGVRPEDVPFGMHSIMMDSFITGAFGLAKGGDALAQKFVKVIEAQGGRVLLKKGVVKIHNEGPWVKALECADGERIEGDIFVSGVHPKKTFELLSDDTALKPVFKSRLSSLRESTASFGVYAEVSGPARLHPRRNHFFFDRDGIEGLFDVPAEPSRPRAVFANSAERLADEKSQNQGVKLLAAGPYAWFSKWENTKVGHRGVEYEDFKKSYSSQLWSVVDKYCPGMQENVSHELTSSPLSNMFFNGSPEGSGYGIYHSISVTGPRALGPRTHLRNLLITGQSTLFPGFLGAATAGIRAAGNIGAKNSSKEIQKIT
ncbi:MAG: NAD(P)/FAD-dependent oxidoreductase [Bdellovibrionota bacterium]